MNATTTPDTVHPDVTYDRLKDAMHDGDAGFCIACGARVDGIEPDAAEYTCEECGEPKVYGAEELILRNLLHLEPPNAG